MVPMEYGAIWQAINSSRPREAFGVYVSLHKNNWDPTREPTGFSVKHCTTRLRWTWTDSKGYVLVLKLKDTIVLSHNTLRTSFPLKRRG